MTRLNLEEVTQAIVEAAKRSRSHDGLRIRVEPVLSGYLEDIGVTYDPQYECYVGPSGIADVMYGRIITEYKKPHTLDTASSVTRAIDQACDYMEDVAARAHEDPAQYVGIVLDGFQIAFVRQRDGDWFATGPQDVSVATVRRLLEYFRGLSRKPLTPDLLVRDFGPESPVTYLVIAALWDSSAHLSDRGQLFFEEWSRRFSQVAGYEVRQVGDLEKLARDSGVTMGDDVARFLFVLHTYYALLIKLVTAEVLLLSREGPEASFIESVLEKTGPDLRADLLYLEDGAMFRDLEIVNFLEGDFFSWYLDSWDDALETAIRELLHQIAVYEPATAALEPDLVRDLLKQLYQKLVPRSLRHDLGEFYTPDWIANLILDELGYQGSLGERVIDPSCGSGTFVILAIKRAKEWGSVHGIPSADLLDIITENIVGFDLNPLAVIAARANYLFAIVDLLERGQAGPVEIPIFLCDSIFTPEAKEKEYGIVYEYEVKTSHGDITLEIPAFVVEAGHLGTVMTEIEEGVRYENSVEELLENLRAAYPFSNKQMDALAPFMANILDQIADLERKGWNRIWCRIIKNSYATATVGEFDYVVGNPSWVRWSRLPPTYAETVKDFCGRYNLFSSDRWVGGIENDISEVLTYSAADKWLKRGGWIGYVITQTVFKSESAEGFRNFTLPDGTTIGIRVVHDMVQLKPFEGANNRTSIFLGRKSAETEYPVPYIKWTRKRGRRLHQLMTKEEVFEATERTELCAQPVYHPGGPWLTVTREEMPEVKQIIGNSDYRARKGVTSDLNGVYWLAITDVREGGVLMARNLHDVGRHTVRPFRGFLGAELVFPLARGRDIEPFQWNPSEVYIIVPQDGMRGYPESLMRQRYRRAYRYLHRYRNQLLARSSYRRYHARAGAPFYSLWNVGPYSFAPFKVVWREIQKRFYSAVIGSQEDRWLGRKVVIPDHKLYFVPCDSEEEAHYLCAVLNAPIVGLAVQGYAVQTQVGTHVFEYIRIPGYDSSNAKHGELTAHSKQLRDMPSSERSARLADRDFLDNLDDLVIEVIAQGSRSGGE